MEFFTEEHEIFRQSFRRFIEKEILPQYDEWEKKGETPRGIWKKLGEQGYLCPWLEEEYGGPGGSFEYSIIINQETARAAINVGFGLHSDIIAPYLASYGTEEQKRKWLPGCASGDTILAIAMTEPNTGSDLQAISTTAIKDGDHYVLNGQKTFISNGIAADLFIVACKTDPQAVPAHKGISLIVVEADTPGLVKGRKLEKLGLRSQDTAEIYFENCRVPVANLLGEEGRGFAYMMEKLQQERLVSSVYSQGLAERMLSDAIEYAKTREAFGQPIGKFQYNAFKIAELATEVELGKVFLEKVTADHLAGKDVVTQVSMAKYWIGEMANRVAYQCLQLYGGYGYSEEYPIARHYRDVRVHTIYAGSSEMMKLIIARKLGF
ncbi:MAG: acyl-CoA dehydrogenase [Clostridia bacterium]|nr:acyl-CoA dehydrogenase [Clostridia bacterium]